ncbi:MAG: hypothetical protein WC943_11570 [Elusimicrobiota bacterium]
MRRLQKLIVIVVLVMNTGGVRFVARAEAGQPGRFVAAPSRGIRAVAKVVTKKAKHHRGEKSWKTTSRRHTSKDLDSLRCDAKVAPVAAQVVTHVPAPKPVPLTSLRERWKLASDLSPVQPPHLSSKK